MLLVTAGQEREGLRLGAGGLRVLDANGSLPPRAQSWAAESRPVSGVCGRERK